MVNASPKKIRQQPEQADKPIVIPLSHLRHISSLVTFHWS